MDGTYPAAGMSQHLYTADGDDTLRRLVYYGEALRAVSEYVSDSLIDTPPRPMLSLMEDAYDRMATARPEFRPEEFALYVMSILLELCDEPGEARQMKTGAARYLLASQSKLSSEFAPLTRDAKGLLARRAAAPEAPLLLTQRQRVEEKNTGRAAASEHPGRRQSAARASGRQSAQPASLSERRARSDAPAKTAGTQTRFARPRGEARRPRPDTSAASAVRSTFELGFGIAIAGVVLVVCVISAYFSSGGPGAAGG